MDSLPGQTGCSAGAHHRFRNIDGSGKSSGHKNARPGGDIGLHFISGAETELVEFDTHFFRQFFRAFRRYQTDGKDDHIEFFLDFLAAIIGIFQEKVMALLKLFYRGGNAINITYAKFIFGRLIISFKTFAEGPDIIVKNSRLNMIIMLSGDNGFLGSIHTADRRAIIASAAFIAGTDALNPGDLDRMFAVRRPLDLTLIRTGGRKNAFKFQAGHHIGHSAVTVFTLDFGIKGIETGCQNNRTDLNIQPLRLFGYDRWLWPGKPPRTGDIRCTDRNSDSGRLLFWLLPRYSMRFISSKLESLLSRAILSDRHPLQSWGVCLLELGPVLP